MLDGTVVGATASVVYSPTVDKILAFAYVKPHANIDGQAVDVIIAGQPRAGRVITEPAYDPASQRPRTDG